MPDATFRRPDPTTLARLDDLGLEVMGQLLESDSAVLTCRVVAPDAWCQLRDCRASARYRDHAMRLAHEPFGWRPTTLLVTMRRYLRGECFRVW